MMFLVRTRSDGTSTRGYALRMRVCIRALNACTIISVVLLWYFGHKVESKRYDYDMYGMCGQFWDDYRVLRRVMEDGNVCTDQMDDRVICSMIRYVI